MKLFLSISILLTFQLALAQKIEVSAELSSDQVSTNQFFRYICRGNARGEFTLPDFSNFQVLGTSPQQSQSVSVINGKMTQSVELSYVVTLRPKKEGNFTIGPAEFKYKGKTYKTNSVSIKVSKGANNGNISSNKPMFARIITSKNSAFVGEPIIATYKLYSLYQFVDLGNFETGNFDGFQVKSLFDNTKNITQNTEVINGKRYFTIVINKVLLFPLEAGDKELSSYSVTAVASRGFFSQMSENLASNTKTLKIKAVPNQPNDYNGAVGKFDIKASVNREELEAGEAFDLQVTISGKGNIHLIDQPVLNLPDDFEIYGDPDIHDNTKVNGDGASGSIQYNYVIRPNTRGEYFLGPFSLSYFNPKTETFTKAKTDSFKLVVKGGKINKSGSGGNTVTPKTDIEAKEDIRHIIKESPSIASKKDFIYGKGIFWTLLILPLILSSLFILIIRKRRNRSEEDIANANRRHASKMAIKVLKKARTSLQEGNNEKFYEELHLSIIAYLKNKMKLDITEMNQPGIQNALDSKGLSQETIDGINSIIEQCQMARYAPIDEKGNEELISKAETIINQIQKVVK